MSTADRPNASAPAERLATACRSAGFVRLTATADGDALASLGIFGAALRTVGVPFQASVARVPTADRSGGTDADATVAFGASPAGTTVAVSEGPLSATAYDAARELGAEPDPTLAVAGSIAGGFTPGGDAPFYDAVESRTRRRPGVATPVAAVAEGLAHTTLVHAGFSGGDAATTDALDAASLPDDTSERADDDRRRLASLVALHAVADAPDRAAERVERAIHPYAGGPFETLGGYADVLDACARIAPGTGVALAIEAARTDANGDLGHASDALDAWREHGRTAHNGLREATTARHGGLFVVHAGDEVPLGTVARLAYEFRSPEPLVLAVGGGAAALYGDRAAELARTIAPDDGPATGRATAGYVEEIDAETAEREVRAAI
jgi:hypothetical protein